MLVNAIPPHGRRYGVTYSPVDATSARLGQTPTRPLR
jgi:hypothetical protein